MADRRRADYSTMIAGAMPKCRQYFYRFAAGLMCVCFAGLGLVNSRFLFTAGTHPDNARMIVSLIFVALATLSIAGQFWYQRQLVGEFDYGSTLRFRTLGIRQTHVRPLTDVAQVKDWRGRGGPIGYRLVFRDGEKVYLEYLVANSIALADQLRRHAKAWPQEGI